MRRWTIEDFDNYLQGRMGVEDVQAFEQALSGDASLRESMRQHRELTDMMRKAFKREALRKRLQRIHGASFSGADAMGMKRKLRRRRISELVTHIAVAATIAAVVALSVIHYTIGLGIAHKEAYVELRNEVQDIYQAQEHLKRELWRSKQPPVLFTGTSFAVSSDGLLATNYHVIRGLDSVWVSNHTDSLVRYTAAIVYANPINDIALLRIIDTTFQGFGTLPFGRATSHADMGDYVFTLGFSKQDVVFGEGSISSVSGHQSDTTSYQISVPVNPGNSGGPLFDSRGNLLGMISGKNIKKDGVGFALKADYLYDAIQEMMEADPEYQPGLEYFNRISRRKRSDQIKTIQPLVFRVQIAR